MPLKTAIEILEYHQEWRMGKQEEMKYDTSEISQAIWIVLAEVKRNILTNNK